MAFSLVGLLLSPSVLLGQEMQDASGHRVWASPDELRRKLFDEYEAEEVRIVETQLDEDDVREVVVAFRRGVDVGAYVLDYRNDKWYEVDRIDAWYKYERGNLLDTFIVFGVVSSPHEAKKHEFFATRESGGGTGIYVREMRFYRLRNLQLVNVLEIPDERRLACPAGLPADAPEEDFLCTVIFKDVVPGLEAKEGIPIIRVTVHEGKVPPESPISGMVKTVEAKIPLPVSSCKVYAWNEGSFRFEEAGDDCTK